MYTLVYASALQDVTAPYNRSSYVVRLGLFRLQRVLNRLSHFAALQPAPAQYSLKSALVYAALMPVQRRFTA